MVYSKEISVGEMMTRVVSRPCQSTASSASYAGALQNDTSNDISLTFSLGSGWLLFLEEISSMCS